MGNILSEPVLRKWKRPFAIYNLQNLRLGRWEIFRGLLVEFKFLGMLGVKFKTSQEELSEYVVDVLRDNHRLKTCIQRMLTKIFLMQLMRPLTVYMLLRVRVPGCRVLCSEQEMMVLMRGLSLGSVG